MKYQKYIWIRKCTFKVYKIVFIENIVKFGCNILRETTHSHASERNCIQNVITEGKLYLCL